MTPTACSRRTLLTPHLPAPLLPGLPAEDKCGRCIRVTNLATGDSIQATVVDKCGTGGMDLDPEVRQAAAGQGQGQGYVSPSLPACVEGLKRGSAHQYIYWSRRSQPLWLLICLVGLPPPRRAVAARRTTACHLGPCVPDGCALPCPLPPHLQAFNPIDTNGNGVRDGHMMVSVEVRSFSFFLRVCRNMPAGWWDLRQLPPHCSQPLQPVACCLSSP